MKVRLAAALVLLMCVASARAQKAAPTIYNLIVSCNCTDSVGKAYARALRDLVAKSPRYEEITDSKENRKRALYIGAVSLPIGDDSDGSARVGAISVVLVFDGTYIDQYIQTCGKGSETDCAQKTFDSVDALFNSQ